MRQGGPKSRLSKCVPFRSFAPFVSPENVHNIHNVHSGTCGSVSVRSWQGIPDVDLALSLEDCEERSWREDADTLVLSPVKEMAVAADDVVHLSLNRTLQVAIVGRIFLNDAESEFPRGRDSEVGEILDERLEALLGPAMTLDDLGVMQHPLDLLQDHRGDHQLELLLAPGSQHLCRDTLRAQDGAHEDIGIKNGENHVFRRAAFARTAWTASATSCSMTAGFVPLFFCCSSSTMPKNRSRRFCRFSSCQSGTTAAIGRPARSMTYSSPL